MAVRIYELSKKIGMDNSDLIALLKERGHLVKSASSTIDNISAESLIDEFSSGEGAEDTAASEESQPTPEAKESSPESSAPPSGAIVRTREEIERERREQEEEQRKARQASMPGAKQPQGPKAPPPPPRKAPPPVSVPQGRGGGRAVRAPVVRSPQNTPQAPSEEQKAPAQPEIKAPQAPAAKPEEKKPPQEEPKEAAKAPKTVSAPPQIKAPPRAPQPPKTPPAPPVKTPPTPPVEEAPEEPEAEAPEALEEEAPAAEQERGKRVIQVKPPLVVRDFAIQIGRKPFQLISELMEMNIFASMNQVIEEEVAVRIAKKHGYELDIKHRGESQVEEKQKEEAPAKQEEKLEARPPVVCILGHVDHGKTTLLDTIRKTNVVKGEAGGITQHIGAYQIEHSGQKITFIDTPGHAAFSNMRARGANVTDVAILVVAADDGFMPQTDEALGHAQTAGVPIIVAINKMDMPGANPDRVLRQMQERNITPEEWGGETLYSKISAVKAEGLDDLLDNILLQAEIAEPKAVAKGPSEGVIMEAQKEVGQGSTASVIIRKGTLKKGDALVCGQAYCRVRTLLDDRGQQIREAGPATPVKITGWSGPPESGETFHTVKNERQAKREAEENELDIKRREQVAEEDYKKASIEDLFAAIEQTQAKVFKVFVKADVYGTAEALAHSLEQIKSDKISLEVVDMGVGAISRNDIMMASAGETAIVGFNVNLENGAQAFAKHHDVVIYRHNIIYELIDLVKDAMADELEPELRENKLGAAEVRAVFPLGKGKVAGCMVTEGHIRRNAFARLIRKGEVVHSSRIETLKRFKEDATEVRAGYECGAGLDNCNDYAEGDMIECYEINKVKPSL